MNWVGESVAETVMSELAAANQIVLDRSARAEGVRRLNLREGADYTKATIFHLGQALDADYICFGSFTIGLTPGDAALKNSSIRISAQFIDLRKMHDGPELSEAGKLAELSRLEEHLAFESLRYLEPHGTAKLEDFLSPRKTVRLDAQESYVRGLLSGNKDQRQKWFAQAVALDSHFAGPAFELGKLALEQKQYPQALNWFRRITPQDPNYPEARFKMGLAAYAAGDYNGAASYFREVSTLYPLSEVYNDLAVAEAQLNMPAAPDDFRRALEGDPHSSAYLFNLGYLQLKAAAYADAAKKFDEVLQHSDDAEARTLLDRANRRTAFGPGDKLPVLRLKTSFDETAFRQLKAMLQPKSN